MPTERFLRLQEAKRNRISEAVIAEFRRTSYGELQISNIARNAKISRASLYTYFPNKEDLFWFALEQIQKQKKNHNRQKGDYHE
ncbi:MAG: TetR/AcrR family transcriptional regulator [Lachnospiraceae bacterium]|nr:TetR/AcrR family transcriptional regulator [Lachnospiraceae bacterium]